METTFKPPSVFWLIFKGLKGTNNATLTVPDADLRGKWILITGSNNGIGREAAIQFAKWGASIILACRQPPPHETHPDQVVEECKAAAAAAADDAAQMFEWWECDMADLSSVEALAARWNATGRPLDLLVNNAGMALDLPRVVTRDGFERVHQVNFLSHTLLTLSVLPSVARAKSPRIICTTSCLHYLGQYDVTNANAGTDGYANNKLYYQIWLTELQARMLRNPRYRHIAVHGVHPGFVASGIWNTTTDAFSSILKWLLGWVGIDSQQGSLAIVNAATAVEGGLRAEDKEEEPAGEHGVGFRGGAKFFNRTWQEEPNPYVWSASHRKEVWDFIADELKSSGRPGAPADLLD